MAATVLMMERLEQLCEDRRDEMSEVKKTLYDGCRIALAKGATELVAYCEWDEMKLRPSRGQRKNAAAYWIAEMTLAHGRLTCQQAYDEKTNTTRAWVRRKCAELLDAIAPGWEIVSIYQGRANETT